MASQPTGPNGEPVVYKMLPTPAQEIKWLREGLQIALAHLQNDRKTLAIDAIKATLSGETW